MGLCSCKQMKLAQKHKFREEMRIQGPTSPHVASALGRHEKPPTENYSRHFSFPLVNKLKIAKISFINVKKMIIKLELLSRSPNALLRVELWAPSVFCLADCCLPPPPCHRPIKINCKPNSLTLLLSHTGCLLLLFYLFCFCFVWFLFTPPTRSFLGVFELLLRNQWTLWTGSEPPSQQTLEQQTVADNNKSLF